MDRFVTRTPTWRTLNYSSFGGQKSVIKNSLKSDTDNKKKPLKQKQICEVAHHSYAFDKQISKLFQPSRHTYTENFNANSNDSGLSSASSTSPQQMNDIEHINNRTFLSPTRNHIQDCAVGKENDVYMAFTRMPKPCQSILESDLQGEGTLEMKGCFNSEVNDTPNKPLLKTNKIILARIQRDLNSPSAAVRMKALKAIKSPTKSAYCHFDISYTEQSLHLPEPPSLEEIMRNIVVYVEVRSGEDNRSAGVRKVIEALGARVSLSLNRETTHVIFKDGLLSTFKKATQMNIPIVSILWIEACKNQRRICDPKEYPISNLDRYENPELYTKMKRVKSMQPDSECNKRIRGKPGGTPKDSTPTQKTGTSKKTSAVIGGTPTSSTNKKKTDISQFFSKIERPTILSISKGVCGISSTKVITDPPAIQPLNTSPSESNNSTSSVLHSLHVDDAAENIKGSISGKIVAGVNDTIGASSQPNIRRCSILHNFEMETTTHSMNTMAISPTKIAATNRRGRRSSIHSPRNMSLVSETASGTINMESILEECDEMEKERNKSATVANKRRTLYTIKTREQTEYNKPETINNAETASKKSRRRTLYASKTMEISDIKEVANTDKINNNSHRRRTSFNFKTLEETQISEISDNKTANNKVINLPNEAERDIPPAAKVETLLNCRRTLYDSKTMGETNVTTFATNITDDSGDYQTPKNFRNGRVSSSTLLDDNDSRNNLITPTADLTNDKLLEETEQCATPLIFSSTRKPGNKRRTLFDASMDIITQRLQCINQSARRSLVPSISALQTANTLKSPIGTPVHNVGTSSTLHDGSTPTPSVESFSEFQDSNNCKSVVSPKLIKKKRRKLFLPNEMTITPPYTAIANSVNIPFKTVEQADKATTQNSKATNSIPVNKRRRTLMPISQPQPTTIEAHKDSINIAGITPTIRKRRSTLDFEEVQTNKTKDSSTEIIPLTQNANAKQFATKKRTPVLAYTNMHQQQIDAIREAIGKLSVFVLESSVTSNTTHLVSLEPRRTINLLRALARGLWILNYSWITDSLKAEKWLPEEIYELKNFSRAVEICRSEHQAFGNKYKCELFRDVGGFYVSSHCSLINKETICELISLCGGQIVNARKKARYIIGDDNKTLEGKLYLTPYWILDSITQMKLVKSNKYAYCSSNKMPAHNLCN